MTKFKSFNDIVLEMLDNLKLTQPNLDIKPNSVARDLFIDTQAIQVANLYDNIRSISSLQSVMNVYGQDLTNYGANYGISRQSGSKAFGTVVVTFRTIDNNISIPAGSVVRTRNGISFQTVSTVNIFTTQTNALRATATRMKSELNLAGINDPYAINVSVQAQSFGSTGNISKYAIVNSDISGANAVTNLIAFTGGTDLEVDSTFRSRILATFAGSNIGTALGYRSAALNLVGTIDALVVEPGDTLMTRDGTLVGEDSSGNTVVVESGTGGKVDVYLMGENLQGGYDGFVYSDKSGTNDSTNTLNDYILGQSNLTSSTNLTLNSRRVATLNGNNEIPLQPISTLVSVSGSISGPNFTEQYIDELGELQGNFKLVKDTGVAGGSSFGLDKFVWTSDQIKLKEETAVKGNLNSVDDLAFSDVTKIEKITQDVLVTNENSTVYGSARNYIITKHIPVRTVTRVYNLTTGERYVVEDQAPDDTGTINTTGRVKIVGRTLPTASDILQVDYTWIRELDNNVDYDNFDPKDNLDQAQDSIEWGFSNYIRYEKKKAVLDSHSNLTITTDYAISRILSIDSYSAEASVVSGSYLGKIVQVSNVISNVLKVTDTTSSGNPEVYNTHIGDGNISNTVIVLPTDTLANTGDSVFVTYNTTNLASENAVSFLSKTITLTPNDIVPSGTSLLVSYVADFSNLVPLTSISALPVSTNGYNSFLIVGGNQPVLNVFSGTTIVENKRRSPTKLKVSVSGIPNIGTIRITGTTINHVDNSFVATANSTLDLTSIIKAIEGTITSDMSIARVALIQKGTMDVTGVFKNPTFTYDLTNYGIKSTKWDKANAIEIPSLSSTQVKLAETNYNVENVITTGDAIRVVFYYAKNNDYEDMFFSRNGSAITNKTFGHINSVNRFYGMQDSGGTISGKVLIDATNQPDNNSTYSVDYDYVAPKNNERITINFEYNKLISDATQAVELKRPITADVLVKEASKVEVDVSVSIVVTTAYKNSKETVKQDVSDNVSTALSASQLGTIVDASDIVNSIYNVSGVDRVNVTRFNKHGVSGTKLSVVAEKNEYIAPGDIAVIIEER